MSQDFFAAFDPRVVDEVIAKFSDASQMHVNGTSLKGAKKQKREAQIGAGLNTVAIVGGADAMYRSGRDLYRTVKPKQVKEAGSALKTAGSFDKARGAFRAAAKAATSHPKTALAVAGAAAGLHAVELGADAVGRRALTREKKSAQNVIDGHATIHKGLMGSFKAARNASKTASFAAMHAQQHAQAAHAAEQVARAKSKVFRASVAGAAVAGTGGGYYAGKKAKGTFVPTQPPMPAEPQMRTASKPTPVVKGMFVEYDGEVTITKRDDEKRQLFGWATVSKKNGELVLDRQNDIVTVEEIEEAAYEFLRSGKAITGDMHERDGDAPAKHGTVIESMVFTPEKMEAMGLAPDALPHGWWIGTQVEDDQQWADYKSGKRTGFSIHGKGRRVPVDA